MKPTIVMVLSVVALAACAGANDAFTPSVRLITDDFDGALIVRQPPVGASSSLGETIHLLGFEWLQKTPDTVYVTAGLHGISAITSLAFNADGRVIEDIKEASATTEFTRGPYPRSLRRFAMPLSDFAIVAAGKSVKMRVGGINAYTVSSFGSDNPAAAMVNPKFAPFIQQIQEVRLKTR